MFAGWRPLLQGYEAVVDRGDDRLGGGDCPFRLHPGKGGVRSAGPQTSDRAYTVSPCSCIAVSKGSPRAIDLRRWGAW